MESLFLLIPLALLSTGIALKAFFWAVNNRQFEDLDQAGRGILFDAELVQAPTPLERPTTENSGPPLAEERPDAGGRQGDRG